MCIRCLLHARQDDLKQMVSEQECLLLQLEAKERDLKAWRERAAAMEGGTQKRENEATWGSEHRRDRHRGSISGHEDLFRGTRIYSASGIYLWASGIYFWSSRMYFGMSDVGSRTVFFSHGFTLRFGAATGLSICFCGGGRYSRIPARIDQALRQQIVEQLKADGQGISNAYTHDHACPYTVHISVRMPVHMSMHMSMHLSTNMYTRVSSHVWLTLEPRSKFTKFTGSLLVLLIELLRTGWVGSAVRG